VARTAISCAPRFSEIGEISGRVVKRGRLAVTERKTLCDLGMVTVDFGLSDTETPDPGNTLVAMIRATLRAEAKQSDRMFDGQSPPLFPLP
jgi:hypothetical protein